MSDEKAYIERSRPDERPIPFWGLTIVARSNDLSSEAVLAKIRSVWSIVADWGRVWDEEFIPLESEDEEDEYIEQLPTWLLESFPEFENWIGYFFEREWVWWSGAILDGLIKIDILAESMPVSTWAFRTLVEKCGSEILYDDFWIGLEEVKKRFS